ncbi:MAG: methyl-accepting chemotaxis protein [Rhodobacteraceae bacterium]|nr:methyl-accepting chemotaxis protein [Paracoccaceae bacterium]
MAGITSKITSIEQSDTPDDKSSSPDVKSPDVLAQEKDTQDLVDAIHQAPPAPSRTLEPKARTKKDGTKKKDIVRPAEDFGDISATSSSEDRFVWVRVVTILMLLLWGGVAAILSLSVLDIPANIGTYSALQWAGIVGMFLGPVLMIAIAGYSLKQLARLSLQAQTLARVAEALSQPDRTVVRKSKTMAAAIAKHVDDVNDKLNVALGQLATLEDVLNVQTGSLAQSNLDATETATQIAHTLERQSDALDSISGTFDGRMNALSLMIKEHTEKLANATHLAEQKIKEARISVEGASSKINAASDIVRTNALEASSTLNASHTDIQSLGKIIRERSVELDNVYKKHAKDLTSMIEHLRDEQQNLGVVLEERLSKMRDLSLSAQASAESLIDASDAGKDTIEALAESAKLADGAVQTRFREMREMVKYSSEQAQSISEKAAQRVKDSLELTRLEISRIEHDMGDLQSRIGQPLRQALELIPEEDDPSDDTPDAPQNTARKQRWTRLKLKPLEDESPLHDEILGQDESLGQNENVKTERVEDEALKIPQPAPSLENEQGPARDDVETPEPETPVEDRKRSLDLYLEPRTPAQDAAVDTVWSTALPNSEKKQKPGFSLRGLFRGREDLDADDSLSVVTDYSADTARSTKKPAKASFQPPSRPSSQASSQAPAHEDILTALEQLGLSPHVIVDDGCIIEAVNSRVSRGHEAMSRIVAERLKSPVKHMVKALSIDSELSQKTIDFATRFDQSIEAFSGNREAIRTRLESEQGRAYLLCDAALNYGRV